MLSSNNRNNRKLLDNLLWAVRSVILATAWLLVLTSGQLPIKSGDTRQRNELRGL